MHEEYKSSISQAAIEKITGIHENGHKRSAEYWLDGEIVGLRFFHESGEPEYEHALKDGVRHGVEYRWDMPGVLLSAEPWEHGLTHGIAKQWSEDGQLIGTYRMDRGTGIDLWWQNCGHVYLSEVVYRKDGLYHGFEWWIKANQKQVCEERHWSQGRLHGIERQWNQHGRLRRGFPRYHVHGERVTKKQYLRASARDPELPYYRKEDDQPEREFPAEIQGYLRK